MIPIWLKRTIQTGFREALLPLGEAGRGFHSRASVPILWYCFDTKKNCDWKQREAFLDVKRRPLRIKETPSSKRRGRFFVFSPAVLANEALPRYIPTDHPLTCFCEALLPVGEAGRGLDIRRREGAEASPLSLSLVCSRREGAWGRRY